MVVTVAVLPWPPAFVPELMGRAASELEPLRHAADSALRGLVAELRQHPDGQVVVVAPGEPGEHEAAGEVSFSGFGRDARVPALPGAAGAVDPELPTSMMVARYLTHRVSADEPDIAKLWAGARWLTVDAAGAARLATELAGTDQPTAVVLLVDGAASHGPKAPRAEDSRAGAFDDAIAEALERGDRDALSAVDLDLAGQVGADGAYLWPVMAGATTGGVWLGDVLFRGEPYGVGWTVALWRRG
ncbi:MAG: hypothetical protein ACXVYW_01795 [Oryzihumus sp.]